MREEFTRWFTDEGDLSCKEKSVDFKELSLAKIQIHNFHMSIMHLLYPPKCLHKHCFQFLFGFTFLPRELENNTYVKFQRANKVYYGQGSQIRQIWRILRQNCSDDSTEVTEGVTSTPKIFSNKQGATLTPEIFGNKHSFVLTFFTTNTIYVIVNIVNLN